MPKSWLKNAPGRLNKKRARGNSSKKDRWDYSRIGGGRKGRRVVGNKTKAPYCCPCCPPCKGPFSVRLQNKAAALAAIKNVSGRVRARMRCEYGNK